MPGCRCVCAERPSRSLQQRFEFVDPHEAFAHVGFEHSPEFEDVPREGYIDKATNSSLSRACGFCIFQMFSDLLVNLAYPRSCLLVAVCEMQPLNWVEERPWAGQ